MKVEIFCLLLIASVSASTTTHTELQGVASNTSDFLYGFLDGIQSTISIGSGCTDQVTLISLYYTSMITAYSQVFTQGTAQFWIGMENLNHMAQAVDELLNACMI
jgi:hypothetical protein